MIGDLHKLLCAIILSAVKENVLRAILSLIVLKVSSVVTNRDLTPVV